MEGNSLKSFENLCKIFEMRIKLDHEKNIDTPEDVLINYEKYAKKIDTIYNSEFEKEIKPLIIPSSTLEKEKERLKKVIKLLEDRLEKRENLENKFYLTTGKYLKGLQLVVSEAELNEKKDRLDTIEKYLSTKNEIESITESIAKLKNSLFVEENKKDEYILKNKIMEDELRDSFIDIIKVTDYYKNIKEEDIDSELVKILDKVKETKETLEVTKDSVSSLISSGSSDDYSSYIEDAERNYFIWKEKEIILKIYGLILNTANEFSEIYEKRENIDNLLLDRRKLREKLNIDDTDKFLSFEKLLLNQINTLTSEREVLENISNYTSRIKFKEERLDELEKDNNSIEILSILQEYGLIDTYDNDDVSALDDEQEEDLSEISFEEEDNIIEDSNIINEVIDPYRIVEVRDYPKTLNIGLAKLKGESVRDKVNKKLNPKEKEIVFEDISSSIEENNNMDIELSETKEPNDKDNSIEIEKNTYAEPIPEEKIPVWEIPSANVINDKVGLDLPKEPATNTTNWYEIKPFNEKPQEEISKINITSENNNILPKDNIEVSSSNTNDMFWIPVADSKLETNEFPSINIPIQSSFTGEKDNFGFPNIENN